MPTHEWFFTWPHTSAKTLLIYNRQTLGLGKGSQVKGAKCQFSFFTLCRSKDPLNFIQSYNLLPSCLPNRPFSAPGEGEGWKKLLPLEPLSFFPHCLRCFSSLSPILDSSPSSQLYPRFRYHWKSLFCSYLDHRQHFQSNDIKHGGSGTTSSHKHLLFHLRLQIKTPAARHSSVFLCNLWNNTSIRVQEEEVSRLKAGCRLICIRHFITKNICTEFFALFLCKERIPNSEVSRNLIST